MSLIVSILADLLVAVLLVACITTSVSLGRRITRLKGDEAAMRQTIGDLMMATESAERAITGLRTTLAECDRTLDERLRLAERTNADLAAQLQAGDEVLSRIGRIVAQARAAAPGEMPAFTPASPAPMQAAAAQAPLPRAPLSQAPLSQAPLSQAPLAQAPAAQAPAPAAYAATAQAPVQPAFAPHASLAPQAAPVPPEPRPVSNSERLGAAAAAARALSERALSRLQAQAA